MQRYNDRSIVLRRIDYGEADRIVTVLTSEHGKRTFMAKGVRRPKSKLAGGVELFAINSIGAIRGRSEIDTLTSARMDSHFIDILADYDAIQHAYFLLQQVDRLTDDEANAEYFLLLERTMPLLAKGERTNTIMAWSLMQLMRLGGSEPNVLTDYAAQPLDEHKTYAFFVEEGAFRESEHGQFSSNEIKAWRVFLGADAESLMRVKGLEPIAEQTLGLLKRFVLYQQ